MHILRSSKYHRECIFEVVTCNAYTEIKGPDNPAVPRLAVLKLSSLLALVFNSYK